MTSLEIARLLAALGLLVSAAHGVGTIFAKLHQPRVIGEIVGGLLLGPTVLGALLPGAFRAVFPAHGPSASTLSAISQLGLLLLMYCSGIELRTVFHRGERVAVSVITATSVLIPFALGLALVEVVPTGHLIGGAHSTGALALVFALAVAVTSIPVISRIMLDLGILQTPFARIVLGVAVIEDTVVYIVLAIALGLAAHSSTDVFGVTQLIGLESGSAGFMVFHVAVTLLFFVFMLTVAPRLYAWALRQRLNLLRNSSPIGYQLVFVFASTLLCLALGITPLFGAFLAGVAASSVNEPKVSAARGAVKDFAFAFFVPVYFTMVGLQLDLLHHFDPVFFAWFLLFACTVKTASVYLGARIARETPVSALNLAVAMNARGGPGIVLASVALTAGIINREFYAALVLLVILTSLAAGTWLDRVVSGGRPLRPEPRPKPPRPRQAPVSALVGAASATATPGAR
jgi:Kef-type K+ transport system membrane component KefB